MQMHWIEKFNLEGTRINAIMETNANLIGYNDIYILPSA